MATGQEEKGLFLGIVLTSIYLCHRFLSTKINHLAEMKQYILVFAI